MTWMGKAGINYRGWYNEGDGVCYVPAGLASAPVASVPRSGLGFVFKEPEHTEEVCNALSDLRHSDKRASKV